MSTYELDDDLVRNFTEHDYAGDTFPAVLAAELAKQIPLPVPDKVGAIVRTQMPLRGASVFIRWTTDHHTTSPWIEARNHEQPYRTDEIGRIVEVLSEGVDL